MSTKSSIAHISDYTWLEEEMLDDTTWLIITGPNLELVSNALGAHLRLNLTSVLLDKIAEVHSRNGFPHQRHAQHSTSATDSQPSS